MTNLVFMGGIHGVGKTTFCKPIAEATGYIHITASQLIKEKNAAAISADSKIVKDADYNQRLLIEAVNERTAAGQKLLLDGHFTIQTLNGIQKLGIEVFRSLGVRAIVVLTDKPESIAERLLNRDSQDISTKNLADYQALEIDNAQVIANGMGVPFYKFTPNDENIRFLVSQLQKGAVEL